MCDHVCRVFYGHKMNANTFIRAKIHQNWQETELLQKYTDVCESIYVQHVCM